MDFCTNVWLALVATSPLAPGALADGLDRPAASVCLPPNVLSFARVRHRWFGAFGSHLPAFVPVHAFIFWR